MKIKHIVKSILFAVYFLSGIVIAIFSLTCDKTDKIPNDGNTDTTSVNILLIADFENGKDPTNRKGSVQSWNNNGKPKVDCKYKSGDGANSNYAIQVTLAGNDGIGEGGWTGGGLVLVLTDNKKGINLEDYKNVVFDIKITEGSLLAETRIKLEDTQGSQKPERLISDYGVNISQTWQRVSIPIKDFMTLKENDPGWWNSLDVNSVSKFITVSVNDSKTNNGDGTLLLDNIQFVK